MNRKEQQQHLRFQVLRAIEARPNITQRELAEEMGVSLGAMNYCVRALVAKGWVKVDNFQRSQHKLRYAYLLTPQGVAEKTRLTASFLRKKYQEYELLKRQIDVLQQELAGEAVAGQHETMDQEQ